MSQRTSFAQFSIMVEYMERHGDLTKFPGGARGRQWCNEKWRDLVAKLNSEGTGKTASEEKWRKVWSDLKNNTKKKWAKINKSVNRTGGGRALKMSLTDLEHRVLAIMGEQAATGMQEVRELGFNGGEIETAPGAMDTPTGSNGIIVIGDEDWNTPGPSQQSQFRGRVSSPRCSTSSSPSTSPTRPPTPRQSTQPQNTQRDKRVTNVEEIFLRMESNAREENRQRDRAQMEIEREKIRLRESELQIRRDELELKAQYLVFMNEALRVLDRFLNSNV